MIAYLEGPVIGKTEGSLIIRAGNVGYRVFVTADTLSRVADEVSLFTYLSVRETALELFGFSTPTELRFFEMLLSVSGIGPRSALAIIGMADPEIILGAIAKGDSAYLTSVSGIGKKTAEKIVLELRDKVGGLGGEVFSGDMDTVEALRALGYSLSEAREAVRLVPPSITTTSKRITEALKYLGK